MVNMQTPAGRFRRIFGWFRRHKVTAVFTVLLVAILLWLLEGWIVWNVQVKSERKQFNAAYDYVTERDHFLSFAGVPSIKKSHLCSYRGDTGFGRHWLSCEVNSSVTYSMLTKQQAQMIDNHLRANLMKNPADVHVNTPSKNFYELSSYSFKYQGLDCDAGTQYYDKEVPDYSVYGSTIIPAKSAHVSLSCSKDAKTEYFPVTKD